MAEGPYLINSTTNNVISFNGLSVFTIGRSGDRNLDIAAIYISRKQCRIENLRNVGWVIFDESRFKTTKLNDQSIGNDYSLLKDGDKIGFSPSSGCHEYYFHCESSPPSSSKKRKLDNELTHVESTARTSTIDDRRREDVLSPLDMLREMATQSSFSHVSPRKSVSQELDNLRKEKSDLELQLKIAREEKSVSSLTCHQTQNCSFAKKVSEVEESNKKLMKSIEDELEELKKKVESMEREKIELQSALTDAEGEIDVLLTERCCKILKYGASKNQSGTNNVDTLTEVELTLIKEDLKELAKKNSDLSLNLETVEAEKIHFSAKVNEIIDSELYCTICSDLIYQAITLQCKHTFCKLCIEEWKKKKRDCPVCRTKIKSQVSCLIIDNLVDKVTEAIGGEMKTRREQMIKERQAVFATPAPRQNKRKRAAPAVLHATPHHPPSIMDPIIDHLDLIGFGPPPGLIAGSFPFNLPGNAYPDVVDNSYPDVVDLTLGSPPHQPFRGFERFVRRRRR